MRVVRRHRSLIAWILYACVVYSALVCSINHGQQSALELGIGGIFCSIDNHSRVAPNIDTGDSQSPVPMPSTGCPLCSVVTLSIAALLCLSWLLRSPGKTFVATEQRTNASPRVTWPPANPRAP
ncbi:DUF2946 domain-containing protein [Pseudomonas japonica]|uniref:DUF2946 domain-containing protein n=1 Tax=Pseudomonas japonica TaxID=256466 RepID=A0A239EBK6_9PSED|nr:Protein of unknown function [Pseudomonas japonica]